MALANYSSAAWVANVGIVPAATAIIEVRRESDGSLANIYSDRQGTTPITNPSAFGDSSGRFSFFAAGGAYRIRVSQNGKDHTLRYQAIGTAQEMDQGDVFVERGSNANGEYVRYADGTQIVWRPRFNFNLTGASAAEIALGTPAAEFVGAVTVIPTTSAEGGSSPGWDSVTDRNRTIVGSRSGASFAGSRLFIARTDAAAFGGSTGQAHLLVVGRWF